MTTVDRAQEPGDWRRALIYAAAVDAGVLAAVPGTVADVSAAAGVPEQAARVVLEALEVWGIVSSSTGGRFEQGPGWPSSDEHLGLLQQARFITGTATGLPMRLRGEPPRADQRSSEDLDRWQAAMAARARTVAPAIADTCLTLVPGARRLLDLGGGHGEYGMEFARRGVSVVLQDRPAMLAFPQRREVWAAAGIDLFPGDFFETLPEEPFDIVFCAGVTHTFDGAHNRSLYRRLRPLVAPDGALVIVSFLRGTERARLFAVQMLVVGNSGDTHSEGDYREWLAEAGFTMELAGADELEQSIIVARSA
jgi:ubiquinone/menaquinone biosynthesis C-methylase UbiE